MGFEPMTPVLPRLCATTAPHGPAKLPVRHRIYLKASAFGQRDDAHPFLTCHRIGHPGIASRQRRRCQSFRQASPQRNHESRTAWWAVEDSNLRRQSQLIYSQSRLTASVTALVYVRPEPTDGVEPTTYGLQNRCSAIELRRPTATVACGNRVSALSLPLVPRAPVPGLRQSCHLGSQRSNYAHT
jgi:hypothetical protein